MSHNRVCINQANRIASHGNHGNEYIQLGILHIQSIRFNPLYSALSYEVNMYICAYKTEMAYYFFENKQQQTNN